MDYYKAPTKDMKFLLDVFDYEGKVQTLEAFEGYDKETLGAIIEATEAV